MIDVQRQRATVFFYKSELTIYEHPTMRQIFLFYDMIIHLLKQSYLYIYRIFLYLLYFLFVICPFVFT